MSTILTSNTDIVPWVYASQLYSKLPALKHSNETFAEMLLRKRLLDTSHFEAPLVDMSLFQQGPTSMLLALGKAVAISAFFACLIVIYFEYLYQVTRLLYMYGGPFRMKRYFPLPTDRNILFNLASTGMCVLLPVTWACLFSPTPWNFGWEFNKTGALRIYLFMVVYALTHDTVFYYQHRAYHHFRTLYRRIHGAHHYYDKEMNAHLGASGEVFEVAVDIGIFWLFWMMIVGRSGRFWECAVPFSYPCYTLALGHSGFEAHLIMAVIHPMVLPVFALMNANAFVTGDHQTHHTFYRYNYALFFKHWDKLHGTWKPQVMQAYDYAYWQAEVAKQAEIRAKNKGKTLGFQSDNLVEGVTCVPTPWGM